MAVGRPLRILFQNRANAFDLPGGDTIVMKRLKERLEYRGMSVDFSGDTAFPDIGKYDLVHLFNLTLPVVTEKFARAAVVNNVPFVVTPLQEDFCRYFHKAVAAYSWFKEHVTASEGGRAAPPPLAAILGAAKPIRLITSPFAGTAANLLCACGETEAGLLRSVFRHDRVAAVPFGSQIKEIPAPASLFEQAFGVKDFVFCVGRVEPRKNQLMLLLALQESDLTVVFADGGFTYQPEYLDLCKRFRRRGRTVFTGRLSDELLVSAYHACGQHCLPSWYELPGLVSLEAALYGCTVVASSWGCLPDYLPDHCFWCSPEDPASVRSAVLAAREKPRAGEAAGAARAFTWENFGDAMARHYERVVQEHTVFPPGLVEIAAQPAASLTLPDFIERITGLVEKGQLTDALAFYDSRRADLSETAPEQKQIDGLMENLRVRLQKSK
jgi:glycosyltransferase involved in cell wall biosynthesis